MTSKVAGLAETVVGLWIKSEGHRKNLLSRQNFCAIAVAISDNGNYYFTQLFALVL